MELFKGQSLLEFTERFKTDLDCEEYLASLKVGRWILLSQMWSEKIFYGFDTESPTVGTLFYAKSPRSYEIQ